MLRVKNTASIPLVIIIPNTKGTKKTVPVNGFILLEDEVARKTVEVYKSWGLRIEKEPVVVEGSKEPKEPIEPELLGTNPLKVNLEELDEEGRKALSKRIAGMTRAQLEEFAAANEIALEGLESNKSKAEVIITTLGV